MYYKSMNSGTLHGRTKANHKQRTNNTKEPFLQNNTECAYFYPVSKTLKSVDQIRTVDRSQQRLEERQCEALMIEY